MYIYIYIYTHTYTYIKASDGAAHAAHAAAADGSLAKGYINSTTYISIYLWLHR